MRYFSMLVLMGCTVGLDSSYVLDKELQEDTGELSDNEDNTTGNNSGGTAGGNTTTEDCGDGIDNDGDTWVDCSDSDCFSSSDCLQDNDGDGFLATNDCDDNDPSINPAAAEIANDGIDQNCDGEDYTTGNGSNTGGSTTGGTTGSTTSGTTSGGTGTTTGGSSVESICNNGIDDDYDGYIDCDDSDCMYDLNCYSGGTTGGTTGNSSTCDDSCIDAYDGFCNDWSSPNWDGDYNYYCSPGTDCFDCSTGGTTGSTTGGSGFEYNCSDGMDDDYDGYIDCDDSDCMYDSFCMSTSYEVCDDYFDNDGDGMVDCDDSDCMYDWNCYSGGTTGSTTGGSGFEYNCSDGIDDDYDGYIDCDDSDCMYDSFCMSTSYEVCDDYFDNDGDGMVDCDDSDCMYDLSCYSGGSTGSTTGGSGFEYNCSDGIDDDYDGYIDCDDSDCMYDSSCMSTSYEVCDDYFDNDGDGMVDCDDSDCMLDWNCYSGGTTGSTSGGSGSCDDSCLDAMDGFCDDWSSPNWDGDYNYYCSPGTDCTDCGGSSSGGSSSGGSSSGGSTAGSTTGGSTGGSCLTDGSPSVVSTDSQSASYNYFTPIGASKNETMGSCGSTNTAEYIIEWTAQDSGCATIDTEGMVFDTVMSIYDDCPSYGMEIYCNDDYYTATSSYSYASSIDLNAIAGETYYIVVEGYSSAPTSGDVDITQDLLYDCYGNALAGTGGTTGTTTGGATCDDSCMYAMDGFCDDWSSINWDGDYSEYCYEGTDCSDCSGSSSGGTTGGTGGNTGTCAVDNTFVSGSIYLATQSGSNQVAPSCNSSNMTSEYIMDYTPIDSGCITFDTASMYTDTILAIYDDCPTSGTGLELGCDDDSAGAVYGTSELSVDVVAGNTYYLLLEGQSSDLTYGLISSSMDIGSSCASGGSSGTCDDSCYAANDGYCDDANSINYNGTSYCPAGTDCSDCSAVAVEECCYTLNMVCGSSGWASAGLYSYIDGSFSEYHTPSICTILSTGTWAPYDSESDEICISFGEELELDLMTWDSSIDIDFSLSDEFGNIVLTPLIEDSWSGSVICGQ